MPAYHRPATLQDALGLLTNGPCRIVAGGTDVYATAGPGPAETLLDVTGITELRGIRADATGLHIGGATTWTELAEADLPPALAMVQQAARQVGGRQVQNMGTLAGNLCNASPAADGVPPLLCLDAVVTLTSPRGRRSLPLAGFLLGPRQTALAPDEILLALHVPAQAINGQSVFLKLGARAHLVISIVSVALRLHCIAGQIADLAIAVGACSAVPKRLTGVEQALIGSPLAGAAGRLRAADVAAALSPLDDIRASAAYRRSAAAELVARALAGAQAGRAA